MAEITKEDFLQNVAKHEMTVDYDNGINRRLVFANPKDYNQWFELITWKGHLCFSGDMGTFVFSRLEDMFDFFRRNDLSINTGYWHEKLEAVDRADGSTKYSQEIFEETIKDLVSDWLADAVVDDETEAQLWEEINDQVLSKSEFECEARHAVDDFFTETDFEFYDFWETSLTEYTRRYIWSLYAIVWGIQQYDKTKMGDYFCPRCETLFDIPASWVSPCCGAETNGGDDYNCPECGGEFDEDMEILVCPNCGNMGGGLYAQPDHAECFRDEELKYATVFKSKGGE